MTGDPSEDHAHVLLVMGPQSFAGDLGAIGPGGETPLDPLRVRLQRVQATTESEVVEALSQPCEAIVLDPGSIEHFSVRVADVIQRLDVPVIIVRHQQEDDFGPLGGVRRVTPVARGTVSGGGSAAYEAAVEAAAWFAWEARRETHAGDLVPTRRISAAD